MSSVSNSKENRSPSRKDSFHVESYSNISKGAHVTDWEHGFNGEDYTIGSSAYEASTMVPQDTLEVSSVSGYPSTCVPGSQEHLQWWTNLSNLKRGSPLHQKEHNLLLFTDASLKGWGAHLNHHTASGLWNQVESRLHINILELKAVFLALKSFENHLLNQNLLISRQFISGCLSQQAGRYPLSADVCTNLENHGLDECQGNPDSGKTYSRESQCVSRFLIKKGQGDSDRMGIESSSIQSDLPLLASTNGRFVCNKV